MTIELLPARRVLRARSILAICLGAGTFWCAFLPPAEARADGGVLGSLGRFLGAPLGGFLDAATAPTIQNVEGATNRVVANVDTRLNGTIGHADQVVGKALSSASGLVSQADNAVSARLSQADGMLAARISQINTSADLLISHAVGGLQAVERDAFKNAKGLVADLAGKVHDQIVEIDQIVDARVEQINGAVRDAIVLADDDVAQRIQQADDAAQRTVGSVDVVATKQSLNLQIALIKVGALTGMLVFLASALRYVFQNIPTELRSFDEQSRARARAKVAENEPSEDEKGSDERRRVGASAKSDRQQVGQVAPRPPCRRSNRCRRIRGPCLLASLGRAKAADEPHRDSREGNEPEPRCARRHEGSLSRGAAHDPRSGPCRRSEASRGGHASRADQDRPPASGAALDRCRHSPDLGPDRRGRPRAAGCEPRRRVRGRPRRRRIRPMAAGADTA